MSYRSPYSKNVSEKNVLAFIRLLKRHDNDPRQIPHRTFLRYGLYTRIEANYRVRTGKA